MFIDIPIALTEAIHNLINIHLFPEQHLRLGGIDHCSFGDAEATWARIGNPYQFGRDAITYHYRIDAAAFELQLLAIWGDEDQATAQVYVVAISPDEEAREALAEWLARVVTGKRFLTHSPFGLGWNC